LFQHLKRVAFSTPPNSELWVCTTWGYTLSDFDDDEPGTLVSVWEFYRWLTGWWYTYPSENYEFASWDDCSQLYGKVIKFMFQTTKQLILDTWKEPSHMAILFLKFQPSIYSSKAADPARSAAAQSTGCFAPAKLIQWPILQCLLERFLTCNLVVSIPVISGDIGNGLALALPMGPQKLFSEPISPAKDRASIQ